MLSSKLDETVKDNLLDELLTGSDTENIENGFGWLIRDATNVEDKVESWPLKSEADDVVRKLDRKVDTGKELGIVRESKSIECWAWLLFWVRGISQHPLPHPGQSTLFSAPCLSHSVTQA